MALEELALVSWILHRLQRATVLGSGPQIAKPSALVLIEFEGVTTEKGIGGVSEGMEVTGSISFDPNDAEPMSLEYAQGKFDLRLAFSMKVGGMTFNALRSGSGGVYFSPEGMQADDFLLTVFNHPLGKNPYISGGFSFPAAKLFDDQPLRVLVDGRWDQLKGGRLYAEAIDGNASELLRIDIKHVRVMTHGIN